MKILRNKPIRIILIIIVFAMLLGLKTYVQRQANEVETTKMIYVVSRSLDSKHLIQGSDIRQLEVSLFSLPDNFIDNKEEVLGKYVIEPVSKGDFLLTSNISEDMHFEKNYIEDGYKLVSLPLKIDEAAGWRIEKDQFVDIVYSPYQYAEEGTSTPGTTMINEDQLELYSTRVINDVKIIDIINEALISTEQDSFAGVPKYIVLMVREDEAEFVAKAKDKGRFDILVKKQKS